MNETPATRYRVLTVLVAVLTVIAVGMVLQAARSVVVPLMIAWLLSYLLGPAVEYLYRRKVPAGLTVAALFLVLLGLFYLGGLLAHERITAFARAFPRYQARLTEIMVSIGGNDNLPLEFLDGIQWARHVNAFLIKLSGSFVLFISKLLVVLIILAFMLLAKPHFRMKVQKAFSPERAAQVIQITGSISRHVAAYLGTLFVVSLLTGLLVWGAMAWIGVDYALTWGLLAFVLNFIPTFGSIVACIPPVMVALVQYYPNTWYAVGALAALLVIQQAIGSVLAPRLFGDRLGLSPVVVLLSLVFWGWLWGITGALLSVPIAASIKIVCEHVTPLRPIGILMGSGRVGRREPAA